MYYFGTSLTVAGHYFWKLDNDGLINGGINFKDIPFDPESLPKKQKGEYIKKGEGRFYNEGDYSVYAIEGAPSDTRGGTKSVFFTKQKLNASQMLFKIAQIPIAMKIINQIATANK